MPLNQQFYEKSSLKVAQELLGSFLFRKKRKITLKFRIVETEAYEGFKDKASHASRGITRRNEIMFGPPGHIYVYFTYGMHYMLNIVTGKEGYPAAVLIRAIEPMDTSHFSLLTSKFNGPARLTKTLDIDKSFNGQPIFRKKSGLWIEKGPLVPKKGMVRAARIGVDYAEEYKEKKWRYYLKNNPFISCDSQGRRPRIITLK